MYEVVLSGAQLSFTGNVTGFVTFDGAATWLKEGGEVQVQAYTIPNVPGVPTSPTPADSFEHIYTERTPNVCSLNQTYPNALASDKIFYQHEVVKGDVTVIDWYYFEIEKETPELVYIGEIPSTDRKEGKI